MTLRPSMRSFLRTLLGAATLFVAAHSFGQAPTDHPNLKGSNARTGVNGDPLNSSPGFPTLRWFSPEISFTPIGALRTNEVNPSLTIIDNTDDGLPGHADGPFDPLLNGTVTRGGTWLFPAAFTDEAIFSYTPARRRNPVGANGRDPNPRFPSYEYAAGTPSAPGNDPRVPLNNIDLRTFTWTFQPK
ncbi:MAG: hypothetical protein C4320_06520, partial [Armatimonadota bacterium]